MTIQELGKHKLRPIQNRIAFFFYLPEKTDGGILIPETYYAPNLKLGKLFVGQVIAVGPGINSLRIGDKFLIHEYSSLGGAQEIKKDEIYFVEEKEILAKVDKGFLAECFNEKSRENAIKKEIENSN